MEPCSSFHFTFDGVRNVTQVNEYMDHPGSPDYVFTFLMIFSQV